MFKMKNKKKKALAMMQRKLLTNVHKTSIISEQFRTIRTNLKFALPNLSCKTILVTSSIPGEGKTTNAANIAIVFAQEGKKVLLVDADMRRPAIHYTFELLNISGLSSVLIQSDKLNEAIQETYIEGLFVLTSGPIPPNPVELLASEMMDTLIEKMIAYYDVIIFDTPPVNSVTDAQILANKTDGVLLIVNTGVVEKSSVVKAKNSLLVAQAKILGVVMNNYALPKEQYKSQYYHTRK
ncbi:capsular biosynthesis protein [Lysinibacillus sphaericus]|uniref:CpsD/CapB family tyrosine-protein kinase n=1 Tax=Lysinibacillus sphaericus TaxID=1421 RepID=UPI0018CFCB10|nr:CpsD/CapB family tyrosine-protein kinase [Lysinibacillus sphaericus]MBG9455254.1 capsular biosynthesis protein [Lysinibacillus sphaericus]MBG9478797.1 capsular biosynthesis protein [Lysinibacillus sphaericus]MBG9592525.1 capsular biosynthesis protein [Lysinibacillus sphaericus]